MPFPNEHAARQRSPEGCKRLRRNNNALGTGIDVIWCVKADGKTEIQTIRFRKNRFTAAEARKWLREHSFKTGQFEAASGD
jgi:hypothetical protein